MEKIFKAKRIDTGEWRVFSLGEKVFLGVGQVGSKVGMYWIDKNTICQYTGINDSEGNRIFEGDYFDSVMIGDYEPMIRGAHVFFCPDELQWQGKLDDKNHCGQLNDYGIKLTGHNIHDKD